MNEIQPVEVQAHQAVLNITYSGQNGTLPDPIDYDAADPQVREWAREAIESGVPGIQAQTADLSDFVIERFDAKDGMPARILVRPKTPFGGDVLTPYPNNKMIQTYCRYCGQALNLRIDICPCHCPVCGQLMED